MNLLSLILMLLAGSLSPAFCAVPKLPPAGTPTVADAFHATARVVATDSFDKEPVGAAQGFLFSSPGGQPAGHWMVKDDFQASSSPHVLAHEAGPTPGLWDLALWDAPPIDDAEITFVFKPMQGDPRLSGGIVWRYQNPQSFYLLEMDSADDVLRLYRYKEGKAKCIDQQQVLLADHEWHTFRIDYIAQTYSIYIDDELAMAGHDKTWTQAGKFGLAADSGSEFYFDTYVLKQVQK